ncbi:hypothetical protein ACTDI4_15395 [Mesorhizobium sp. PUT5]|uniref:hypothetical protein n=1 Tax=Mesorhizobium sp. PUT5 TaxID=3454629 RepID=UPI003FA4A12E
MAEPGSKDGKRRGVRFVPRASAPALIPVNVAGAGAGFIYWNACGERSAMRNLGTKRRGMARQDR